MSNDKDFFWQPGELLSENKNPKIALLLLNSDFKDFNFLKTLWNKAVLRIAVDGGANILHQMSDGTYIPDLVTGDFDSIDEEILTFYKNKGAKIVPTPDQDYTDFTKAFQVAVEEIKKNNLEVDAIIGLCKLGGGGRTDHMFANFNTLYLSVKVSPIPLYIVEDASMSWLLSPGKHRIQIPESWQKLPCGLIPLGEPCKEITTKGLKWNLDGDSMAFGGLISTSNTYSSTEVEIKTDTCILWTMSVS